MKPKGYRVAVLAGTRWQFVDYCRVHGLAIDKQAQYISDDCQLRGMLFHEFVRVGTWYQLPASLIDLFALHEQHYKINANGVRISKQPCVHHPVKTLKEEKRCGP